MRDFNNTINVLVKAYMDGTLQHKLCTSCAVGTIVADCLHTKPKALEIPVTISGYPYDIRLKYWCHEYENGEVASWYMSVKNGESCEQTELTGYSVFELNQIERAFETADPGKIQEEWTFNGLMDVVEVLAEIHGIDLIQKQLAKELFIK